MSWNNDNVPEIVYDYDDSEAKRTIAAISAILDKDNFGSGGTVLRNMMASASHNLGSAVNKTANDTVKEVADLMRDRQYRQPSYHPGTKPWESRKGRQRMVQGLKDHVDGNRHRIYTDVTNNGYNYSQAFEFGLLTKNYPAHHPFQDAASHLDGKLEKNADEAIRKGFDE